MPQRRYRSRSIKRKILKTPSGKRKIHYRRPNPGFARCGACNNIISSVPRRSRSSMQKLSKSSHRPNRMYGGFLCSRCIQRQVKNKIYSSS